jgi:protein-S-isoprenylcysteine O-methyltransferase Ste14
MIYFKFYLLLGLLAHKALWEVLKRRGPGNGDVAPTVKPRVQIVKLVKLAILLGILAQTMIPWDVLPIMPTLDDSIPLRAAGGILYTFGLVVAVLGRLHLGNNWSDIEVNRIQDKHQTVTTGIYAYLRHPIYVGDLLLLTGLELALNSWLVLGVLALTPIVLMKAVKEEKVLAANLTGYDDYARRVKRFIPYVV